MRKDAETTEERELRIKAQDEHSEVIDIREGFDKIIGLLNDNVALRNSRIDISDKDNSSCSPYIQDLDITSLTQFNAKAKAVKAGNLLDEVVIKIDNLIGLESLE